MKNVPVLASIILSIIFSAVAGFVYFVLLHEQGSMFYIFAALAFIFGPFIAGLMSINWSEGNKLGKALASGTIVFIVVFILFFIMYSVTPLFERTSVQLPKYCNSFSSGNHPNPTLAYNLSGVGTGVLVASDDKTVVVAIIDYNNTPYPSTVYIANKNDGKSIHRIDFPDNTIVATIYEGVVYIYDDKLGYSINAHTGDFEKTILKIDNYGGLSQSNLPILPSSSGSNWYLETTAVISSWYIDGKVISRPHLTMNGIAFNCFIDGKTGEIIQI